MTREEALQEYNRRKIARGEQPISIDMAQDELGRINNKSQMPESQQKESSWRDYIPQPSMPLGLDIASGMLSLGGHGHQEKEMIKNLPQIMTGQQPGLMEKIAHGIGESAPMLLAGSHGLSGLKGLVAGSAQGAGFGAAASPNDRIGGATLGGLLGATGEIIPSAISGIGHMAEKLRPVKYVKNKIFELKDYFQDAKKQEKYAFESALDIYGKNNKITDNPHRFLGFDKEHMSQKAKSLYDKFIKGRTIQDLHNLQSQFFKDANSSTRFKRSTEEAGINIRDKAEESRINILDKIRNILAKNPQALADYNKGVGLTRDVIKPLVATKGIREIITGKVNSMDPIKFKNLIEKALKVEGVEIPAEHHLRNLLPEVEQKIELGKLSKDLIPEMIRKFSPKFVRAAQNPKVEKLMRTLNKGYQPIKRSLVGSNLQD